MRTVGEMKDFLNNFPEDMPLLMEGENEMLVVICPVNSEVEELIIDQEGEERIQETLILRTCPCEIYESEFNQPNPEMN